MKVASLVILGLSLLLPLTRAEAAQFVVVEARGIALQAGTVLDGAAPLALQQGQHVSLIAESGATLKLDGPYNKAPESESAGGSDLATALQPLVARQGPRLAEVGVVRGTTTATLPEPWLLDVGRTGNVCLRDGQEPTLWRPVAAHGATLSVMPGDRSWKAAATWPDGSDRLLVPASVPLHAGSTYLVSLGGGEVAITVHDVPASLTNNAMRAAWMADKGCEAQAEALLRQQ